jgi:hypothetical protein
VLGQRLDDHGREGNGRGPVPAILHLAEHGLRTAVANELSIDFD